MRLFWNTGTTISRGLAAIVEFGELTRSPEALCDAGDTAGDLSAYGEPWAVLEDYC